MYTAIQVYADDKGNFDGYYLAQPVAQLPEQFDTPRECLLAARKEYGNRGALMFESGKILM